MHNASVRAVKRSFNPVFRQLNGRHYYAVGLGNPLTPDMVDDCDTGINPSVLFGNLTAIFGVEGRLVFASSSFVDPAFLRSPSIASVFPSAFHRVSLSRHISILLA